MADQFATPSEDEIKIARSGLTTQAIANGLDINDPGIAAFIEGQIKVQSLMFAEIRELYKIMHKNEVSQ